MIDNCFSRSTDIVSGVSQGSVLGPLLFVIFVNDLSDILPPKIKMKLFADDVKLYTEVHCDSDLVNLHECISRLVTWAKSWQLKISINKCCTLDIFQNKRLEVNNFI